MANDETELGRAVVSLCKAVHQQAKLIDAVMVSQRAFAATLKETHPELLSTFQDHTRRITEEDKNRPLVLVMLLLEGITTKLQSKYGPWEN